jgi:hypothetical protein
MLDAILWLVERVLQAWARSDRGRANMLKTSLRLAGYGSAFGSAIWSGEFAMSLAYSALLIEVLVVIGELIWSWKQSPGSKAPHATATAKEATEAMPIRRAAREAASVPQLVILVFQRDSVGSQQGFVIIILCVPR